MIRNCVMYDVGKKTAKNNVRKILVGQRIKQVPDIYKKATKN